MRLNWSGVTDGTMAVPPEGTLTKQEIIANRRRFISKVGQDPDGVTAMRLGKSGNDNMIRVLPGNNHTLDPDQAVQAEALIMDKPAKIFAVAADCPVVGLETPHYLAVVHSGWRGAAGLPIDTKPSDSLNVEGEGIVVQVVRKMRQLEEAATVRVRISPCICGEHYSVNDDVARIFQGRFPGTVRLTGINNDKGPLYYLDLPRIVAAQLHEIDVTAVHDVMLCTFEDETLFSDRKFKQGKQQWGRLGVLVVSS